MTVIGWRRAPLVLTILYGLFAGRPIHTSTQMGQRVDFITSYNIKRESMRENREKGVTMWTDDVPELKRMVKMLSRSHFRL